METPFPTKLIRTKQAIEREEKIADFGKMFWRRGLFSLYQTEHYFFLKTLSSSRCPYSLPSDN
jgi:hypothetical protein